VVGGRNLSLQEINAAAQVIHEVVDENAEIVFGAAIDEELSDDEVKVTVIATGFQTVSRRHDEAVEPAVAADHLTLEDYQRGWSPELPQVDTELPAFLRRNVTAR